MAPWQLQHQQHEDEDRVEREENRALAGENIDVEGRQQQIDENSGDQAAGLDQDITAGIFRDRRVGGRARDEHDAEQRRDHAQQPTLSCRFSQASTILT